MQNRLNRFLLTTAVLFAAVYFFLKIMASPYSEASDTLSLFNPVYMEHFYGKMAYPAYNLFDNMVVHPPLHYKLIAFFYGLGFNLHASMMLPLFLTILIVLFLILVSDFEFERKISFIMALVGTSTFAFASVNIRPDYLLSICWFGGLICLENARITRWNNKWMLAGAFLLSISSTLHYFGAFAFLGVLPYVFEMYFNSDRGVFKKKMFPLIAPILLIVGGYLCLQVLPNSGDIAHQIFGAYQLHKTGSLTKHYEIYTLLFGGSFFQKALIVPVGIIAFLLLIFSKKTRLFVLGSLPVTLFVLLFSNGKSEGYLIPEFLLFIFALTFVNLKSMVFLYEKMFKSSLQFLKAAVLFFLCIYIIESGKNILVKTNRYYASTVDAATRDSEMLTIRACSQHLLGTDAKIGSRMDLWFVSGGKDWFNILPDLFQGDKYPMTEVKNYLLAFDAIADHAHMSNNSLRKDKATLSSLYIDGSLKLKGFYLTNNFGIEPEANVLPMLFYSVKNPSSISGFSCRNNRQVKFYEQDSIHFDCRLLTAVVSVSHKESLPFTAFEFCNLMTLPDKSGGEYQFAKDVKESLLWGIIPNNKFDAVISELNRLTNIREIIPLSSREVKADDVLMKMDLNVNFYESREDYLKGVPYYH